MHIVIFGANGLTGRLLTRRVLDAGHSAVAVTRRPDEFPVADPRLTVAGADVRRDGLAAVVAGADAVLSTLGVPFTRGPVDTYSVGTRNVVNAMREAGVDRLVVVSSTGASPAPGRRHAPLALRLFEPIVAHTIGKTVYHDIRRMEALVRESGLDWTIVRPSGLFDLPRLTNYVAGEVDPVGAFTARIDLADYLVKLVQDGAAHRKTVVVSTTEHTPTVWEMIRREAFKGDAPLMPGPTSSPNV
ncbi:NAD-dependent epimerase [Mycobacterium sp. 852002-50816_SCH5313054-b]|uniref:NAD(P)-dependent oxidoreductase n=1 Tax=Mycobacterium sp. 852002-50816_SCH5313054-b TaxID=1834092 RepID=UPI0007FC8051|nr:NAD(P)H-binding protein [Mycobacterium sp. 852002-50816_SCH5313054-b]OBF62513.1 NAD-dependent epimerase [Mycobacterium sp. 852002-50816_SCH5313054-b]